MQLEIDSLYGKINEMENEAINKENELKECQEQKEISEKELENFNNLCKIVVSDYEPKNEEQEKALNELLELIK